MNCSITLFAVSGLGKLALQLFISPFTGIDRKTLAASSELPMMFLLKYKTTGT